MSWLYYFEITGDRPSHRDFYTSPSKRAKAAMDLCVYLADAGLNCSPKAKWQLHDNNWCVDGQITYHEGSDVHSISAHYDSETGWGWGVC
jgi:hypothetical protein